MPYASLSRPSMALGLLKGILTEAGIDVTVAQAGLWFAERTGVRRYEVCASRTPTVFLSGEWTFAAAAFGQDPCRDSRDEEYLGQVLATGKTNVDDLRALREAATEFTDEAARRVLATGARVVGCTSTFEQHVASLALLRRIRELDPDVVTMLGGANCETVMGEATHRCFGWVDYVVSGEADGLITDLVRMVLADGRDVPVSRLPRGVLGPAHRAVPAGRQRLPRALFADLDALPAPRFDDYFATLAASSLRGAVRPGIPLETSRGCWWGAVHQCTFCGLNGTSLGYRSKSPAKVLAEVAELEQRHGIADFEAVDNILDMGYFTTLLPELAARPGERRIFYEIKANVGRKQIQAMTDAGVTWVQPGIESLHTEVLRLMDKGIKGWQNVQLLKRARAAGLRLSWSILWGFPGEKDDWYQDMARWLPALEHLPPPASTPRIRFDRYSVYHEQAERRGLILFPIGAMSLVYPVGPADAGDLAYFFDTEPGTGPLRYVRSVAAAIEASPGVAAMISAARAWGRARGSALSMTDSPVTGAGRVLAITDTRACATARRHVLSGLSRAVCLACDDAPRAAGLPAVLERDFGLTPARSQLDAVVARLLCDRLVLALDGRLVGLALPASLPPYPDASQFPGGHVSAGLVDAESR
jgi:ribosomal peptide maturation radical SAM protein 1